MSSSVASYVQANNANIPGAAFENYPLNHQQQQLDHIYDHSHNNQRQETKNVKQHRLKISPRLHWTAILAFASYIILVISFASPYWLASYKFTDSTFIRLGLWDFCFQDYRHPSYQYDTKFTGCHWIYSSVYTNIRDFLQPPWFMFVQAVATIALCVSTCGLLAISVIFMHFLIDYQLIIISVALICHVLTTILLTFALLTFYMKAFDRSWIMYPDFNHVDWSFFFALTSMGGNGFASFLYYKEAGELKHRLLKMKRLIMATSSNGHNKSMLSGMGGGDADSIDAVYANRSMNLYNTSHNNNNNNESPGYDVHRGKPEKLAARTNLVYPHFSQVWSTNKHLVEKDLWVPSIPRWAPAYVWARCPLKLVQGRSCNIWGGQLLSGLQLETN